MSEQNRPHSAEFDQYIEQKTAHEKAAGITNLSLCLGGLAMRFAAVERVPRYTPETRENDAEHSYMLALVATEIADQYFPELDSGLVGRFALVHDLLELETGDVATFGISQSDLDAKHLAERRAVERLLDVLPKRTGQLLKVYEQQDVPEARFVRFIDKLLPLVVDILGPGSQVMHEDYNTYTKAQLIETENKMAERFAAMFPEQELTPLHIARNSLAHIFSSLFQPAESNRGFA